MDGGSTGGSERIAAECSSRLTWVSEPDRGQAHAINKGFQRARGVIVAWVNSDDVLLPGAAIAAARAFALAPASGGVYGGGLWIDERGNAIRRLEATRDFDLWRLAFLEDYILQPACFFRREAVAECGWLDESLHWTMDWDILIRLGKRFGLMRTDRDMAAMREHNETKTATGGRARLAEISATLRKHTGIGNPPGRWLYTLNEWSEQRKWRPARIGLTAAIDRLHRLSQALDSEMTAGPRSRFMAPAGTKVIRIEGQAPDWQGTMELYVLSRNRELAREAAGRGDFEIEIGMPADLRREAALFEIRASGCRWVWPGREVRLARRVCWRLRHMAFL
jgi:hypothetical protein